MANKRKKMLLTMFSFFAPCEVKQKLQHRFQLGKARSLNSFFHYKTEIEIRKPGTRMLNIKTDLGKEQESEMD